MKKVLGIETSCDETSLSLIEGDLAQATILGTKTFSQIDLFREWGGVVPEVAARSHSEKIVPLLKMLLAETKTSINDIDLVGVTCFPGLLGPLLTGLNVAKTICLLHKLPLVPVNHLHAHVEAIHLTEKVNYPYLGIILSGGHSLFCLVNSPYEMKVLASTIDDAAGEAFDKGGKLMGMDYPAGKTINDLAKLGKIDKYDFPIGLVKETENPNMSFSGLKTAIRNLIEKNPAVLEDKENLCASYQEAIVQSVRTKLAIIQNKYENLPIVVGGGVACNSRLREVLIKHFSNIYFVQPRYCTDNADMIANLALRASDRALPFPKCLEIDAKSRFIEKDQFVNA